MTTMQERSLSPHKLGKATLHLANPPVAETSAGFYFQKVEGWSILHQGLLWDRFRQRYPLLEILPTIVDPARQPIIQFTPDAPLLRTGFTDPSKTQLVQFQDTLLMHNWRKSDKDPTYHRYERLKQNLRDDWATFTDFLRHNSLGEPVVPRCEMSYFNHLVRGQDWSDFSELSDFFTVWRTPPADAAFGTIQIAAFNVLYKLETGTVAVLVQPAILASDGKEIIQFSLAASAPPKNSQTDALFACLDECHENAHRAFVDFTTEAARERWKQQK